MFGSLSYLDSPGGHLVAPVVANAVISVNVALLAAASIAGHVWTSGVVGVAWAILNATVVWPSGEHSGKSTDERGLTKASAGF